MKRKAMVLFMAVAIFSISSAFAEEPPKMGSGMMKSMMADGMMDDAVMGCMKGDMMGGMHGEYHWMMVLKKLNLTDKQKEQIEAFNRGHMRELLKDRNDLGLQMYDLKYELKADVLNEVKVNELVENIAEIYKKMLSHRIAMFTDLKKALTKEQWNNLKNMKLMDSADDAQAETPAKAPEAGTHTGH